MVVSVGCVLVGCAMEQTKTDAQQIPQLVLNADGQIVDGLPDGAVVFNQDKLRESIAPAWTVFAVAYHFCGERVAIEYLGRDARLSLRAKNAKTEADRAEFKKASDEFDDVLKHAGRAKVEELDEGCTRL